MSGRRPDRHVAITAPPASPAGIVAQLLIAGGCPCGGPVHFEPGPGGSVDVTVTHVGSCPEAQPGSPAPRPTGNDRTEGA